MSDVMHREVRNGFTIEIVCDPDRESPREDTDMLSHFIVFDMQVNGADGPHDGTIDEDTELSCWRCGDTPNIYCLLCQGTGDVEMTCFSHWVERLKHEYGDIVFIRPVLWETRAGQQRYMFDSPSPQWINGPLDSRTIGFMFFTADQIDDTETPDFLAERLTAELIEFNDWANGNCFGYRLIDCNGDVTDSCWGFVCDYDGYVLSEARDIADILPPVEPLHTVRFTTAELATIVGSFAGFNNPSTPTAQAVLNKIMAAVPPNEETA